MMSFKARIYLRRSTEIQPRYLGELELDNRPVPFGQARFIYKGKIETGWVETVKPHNWEPAGLIPTVYVI